MMRSGYPHYMSGWYTVFKCLRLAFYQRCQRCGVSIGRLAHPGVGVVIDPFPLTVTDRKNGKRTHWNIGVLLSVRAAIYRHNNGVTREIALFHGATVSGGGPLLTEFPLRVCESKN